MVSMYSLRRLFQKLRYMRIAYIVSGTLITEYAPLDEEAAV
jgi:hypothetical protein